MEAVSNGASFQFGGSEFWNLLLWCFVVVTNVSLTFIKPVVSCVTLILPKLQIGHYLHFTDKKTELWFGFSLWYSLNIWKACLLIISRIKVPGLLTRGALHAPTLNPAGFLASWMRPIQGPQLLGGCHGNQPRINQNLLHPGHYILWCYCDDYTVHYVYSDRISGIILFSLFFGFFMVLGLLEEIS